MKYLDKFLKVLKTDRNTFFTYILTLISAYICVDRLVEMLFMALTGFSVSYWGPITYTIAMACPIFAFLFSGSSKFASEDKVKLSFFYTYCIALYIIVISMVVQWINQIGWFLIVSVPNYLNIISNFQDVIKPAFTALACYFPIVTFYPLFKWLFANINDTKDYKDSIFDYGGIDLSDKKTGWGPYTCEMILCKDKESGKIIKTPEARRFESTLIVGVSGSGKTSMMFEPMIARDIEKKFFFREAAKEMGFTALKTGLATLNVPYSNDYINNNFSLDMLIINNYKEKLYKTYMKNLILASSGDKITYKDLGITYVAPDYESIGRIIEVANNYHMKYNLIDPNNPDSIGLNPFVYKNPVKTAITISSILKRLYEAEKVTVNEAYMQNMSFQAVENLTLLLCEAFKRREEKVLPTLEDLLRLLNNFDLVEQMCETLKMDPTFVEEYSIQISYFEKTFYKGAVERATTEKYLSAAAIQIESLLRYPGIKNILCNRTNNLNFDKALSNGEITLVCTRRGDLGPGINKAFGLFVLLLMQQSVLSRPGNEKNRIPHFLYIDEFPPFVCKATQDIFTLYRKYRVGTIISAQNLSQFGRPNDDNFRETILANCTTKIVFGNNTPADNEWWSKELGEKREWTFTNDMDMDKLKYNSSYKGVKWAYKENYKPGKIQSLKFKAVIYKTKDLKGKSLVGAAKVDFLESKFKEEQKVKKYNFEKYSGGVQRSEVLKEEAQNDEKFDLKHLTFNQSNPDNPNDIDPIKNNTTDSKYFFENDDAISISLKKKNTEE